MIFKITIDENNERLRQLLNCQSKMALLGKEFYFAVTAFANGFYFLDSSWVHGEPMTLRAWKVDDSWTMEDTKGVFFKAYNVKIEVVDSFPTPT